MREDYDEIGHCSSLSGSPLRRDHCVPLILSITLCRNQSNVSTIRPGRDRFGQCAGAHHRRRAKNSLRGRRNGPIRRAKTTEGSAAGPLPLTIRRTLTVRTGVAR